MKKLFFIVAACLLAGNAFALDLKQYEGTWVSEDAKADYPRVTIEVVIENGHEVLKGSMSMMEPHSEPVPFLSEGILTGEGYRVEFTSGVMDQESDQLIITGLLSLSDSPKREGPVFPSVISLRKTQNGKLNLEMVAIGYTSNFEDDDRARLLVDHLTQIMKRAL